MKYSLFVLLFMSGIVSAECVPVIKSGEYRIKTGGQYLVNPCSSKPCMNQKDAKAVQDALLKSKNIGVDIVQPTIIGSCGAASKSSSSAASSVSVSSSSVAVSSAQASSVQSSSSSSLQRVTLSWQCPTLREDETILNVWDIQGYSLLLGDKPEIVLVSTGCNMNHIVDAPQEGQIYKVATIAKQGGYSTYKNFE